MSAAAAAARESQMSPCALNEISWRNAPAASLVWMDMTVDWSSPSSS